MAGSSLIQKAVERWQLTLQKPYASNTNSFVAPCRVNGQQEAVLKIGDLHEESLQEIDGLLLLDGKPTVHLLDYDREMNAMLLEACQPGTPLNDLPESAQDLVICDLVKEIRQADHRSHAIRSLAKMVDQWNRETYDDIGRFPDPELAKLGCRMKERLIESAPEQVLLVTDLHAGNVLRAQRREWVVIDIKPYTGDPAYDLTQHLMNSLERLKENPGGLIDRMAELSGTDRRRLRDWMFARLAAEMRNEDQGLALLVR